MIKNIVFDVGQVLLKYDPDHLMRRLGFDETTIQAVNAAMFQNYIWAETDRGVLPEEQILSICISHNPAYEKEMRLVHERFGECLSLMPYAVEWVKSLKARGYRLYILSNYGEYSFEQSKEKMEFLPYMNGEVFSYRCQLIKPDPHIYHYLLDTFHLDPSETVFMDDRADNIEIAQACGLHGILFTTKEETEPKLEALLMAGL